MWGRRSLWKRVETIYGINSSCVLSDAHFHFFPSVLLSGQRGFEGFWKTQLVCQIQKYATGHAVPFQIFPVLWENNHLSPFLFRQTFFLFAIIGSLGNSLRPNCHLLCKHMVLLICCKGSTVGVNIIHSCLIQFIFIPGFRIYCLPKIHFIFTRIRFMQNLAWTQYLRYNLETQFDNLTQPSPVWGSSDPNLVPGCKWGWMNYLVGNLCFIHTLRQTKFLMSSTVIFALFKLELNRFIWQSCTFFFSMSSETHWIQQDLLPNKSFI